MLINNTRFLNETWFYTLPFRGQIILALKILYPIHRGPKEHFVMTEIYDCIIKTYQKKRWSKFSRLSKNWCLARALPRFTMNFFLYLYILFIFTKIKNFFKTNNYYYGFSISKRRKNCFKRWVKRFIQPKKKEEINTILVFNLLINLTVTRSNREVINGDVTMVTTSGMTFNLKL